MSRLRYTASVMVGCLLAMRLALLSPVRLQVVPVWLDEMGHTIARLLDEWVRDHTEREVRITEVAETGVALSWFRRARRRILSHAMRIRRAHVDGNFTAPRVSTKRTLTTLQWADWNRLSAHCKSTEKCDIVQRQDPWL